MQALEEKPFLEIGTMVSAKYRGAYCESTIKSMKKDVKCRVQLKNRKGSILVDHDFIKGEIKMQSTILVKYSQDADYEPGFITKVTDKSKYTVLFNDGDESVVTRSHICLMGERHFGAKVSTIAVLPKSTTRLGKHSTVTLDELPLGNPEHWAYPVSKSSIAKQRNNTEDSQSNDSDSTTSSIYQPHSSSSKCTSSGVASRGGGRRLRTSAGSTGSSSAATTTSGKPPSARGRLSGSKTATPAADTSSAANPSSTPPRKRSSRSRESSASDGVNRTPSSLSPRRTAPRHAHSRHRQTSGSASLTSTPTKSRSRSAEHSASRAEDQCDEAAMFATMVLKNSSQPRPDADSGGYEVDPPIINDVNVDLWNLYVLVKNRGGFNKITYKLWKEIYDEMNLGNITSGPDQLKRTYKLHLFDFATAVQSKDTLKYLEPLPRGSARGRQRNVKSPLKQHQQMMQQQQQQQQHQQPHNQQQLMQLHQQQTNLIIPKMSTDTQIERLREMTIKVKQITPPLTPEKNQTPPKISGKRKKTDESKDDAKTCKIPKTCIDSDTSESSIRISQRKRVTKKMNDFDLTVKDKRKVADTIKKEVIKSEPRKESRVDSKKSDSKLDIKKEIKTEPIKQDIKSEHKKEIKSESKNLKCDPLKEIKNEKKNKAELPKSKSAKKGPLYKVDDRIGVHYYLFGKKNGVYGARVTKIKQDTSQNYFYRVHYDGWNKRYDEWVTEMRISQPPGKNSASSSSSGGSTTTAVSAAATTTSSKSSPSSSDTSSSTSSGTASSASTGKSPSPVKPSKSRIKKSDKEHKDVKEFKRPTRSTLKENSPLVKGIPNYPEKVLRQYNNQNKANKDESDDSANEEAKDSNSEDGLMLTTSETSKEGTNEDEPDNDHNDDDEDDHKMDVDNDDENDDGHSNNQSSENDVSEKDNDVTVKTSPSSCKEMCKEQRTLETTKSTTETKLIKVEKQQKEECALTKSSEKSDELLPLDSCKIELKVEKLDCESICTDNTKKRDSKQTEIDSKDSILLCSSPAKIDKKPPVSHSKRSPTKKRIYEEDKVQPLNDAAKESATEVIQSPKRLKFNDSDIVDNLINQGSQYTETLSLPSTSKDESNVLEPKVEIENSATIKSKTESELHVPKPSQEVSLIDAVIVSRVFNKTQTSPNSSKPPRNPLDSAIVTRLQNEELSSKKQLGDVANTQQMNETSTTTAGENDKNVDTKTPEQKPQILERTSQGEEEDEHCCVDIDIEGDSDVGLKCTPNASDMLREKMTSVLKNTQDQHGVNLKQSDDPKNIIESNMDVQQTPEVQSAFDVNAPEYFEDIVEIDNGTPPVCTHVEISEVSVEIDPAEHHQTLVEQEVVIVDQQADHDRQIQDPTDTSVDETSHNDNGDEDRRNVQKHEIDTCSEQELRLREESVENKNTDAIDIEEQRQDDPTTKCSNVKRTSEDNYESFNTNIISKNQDDSYTSSIEYEEILSEDGIEEQNPREDEEIQQEEEEIEEDVEDEDEEEEEDIEEAEEDNNDPEPDSNSLSDNSRNDSENTDVNESAKQKIYNHIEISPSKLYEAISEDEEDMEDDDDEEEEEDEVGGGEEGQSEDKDLQQKRQYMLPGHISQRELQFERERDEEIDEEMEEDEDDEEEEELEEELEEEDLEEDISLGSNANGSNALMEDIDENDSDCSVKNCAEVKVDDDDINNSSPEDKDKEGSTNNKVVQSEDSSEPPQIKDSEREVRPKKKMKSRQVPNYIEIMKAEAENLTGDLKVECIADKLSSIGKDYNECKTENNSIERKHRKFLQRRLLKENQNSPE